MVREKLQELGQQIDHDLSGLVYTPLAPVEVCTSSLACLRTHIPHFICSLRPAHCCARQSHATCTWTIVVWTYM